MSHSSHTTVPQLAAWPGLFLALAFCLASLPCDAKRPAPKQVPPVRIGSIKYWAPHDRMGYVVATDTSNGKELWRVRIYSVLSNPFLEKDVQDVFISSLVISGGSLLIENERGEKYALDVSTRKVSTRK